KFLPFQPREDVARMFGAADICLVTLAPGAGKVSVPSKAVAYLAAGKPVVASVDLGSDTAEMIRDSGAGWVVDSGDSSALADAIARAIGAPLDMAERGAKGHAWFLAHHAKRVVLQMYEDLILDARRSQSPLHG